MTCLIFDGNCAGFGSIGFDDSAANADVGLVAFSILASAMEPNPMPQRSSMPRRPMAMGEEFDGWEGFIELIHKNKFIGQQQRLSQLGPGVQSARFRAV